MKQKSRIKEILIVCVAFLCVGFILAHTSYHFSRGFQLTKQTQKIFWSRLNDNANFKKADGLYFSKDGGGFHDGFPVRKSFTLVLDDQWTADYDYDQSPDDIDTFTVWLLNKENPDKNFAFYVSQTDLKVRKDQKYIDYASTSPQERQQIDRETTPDSITDTDKLEKLALKKFVKFQDEYFKPFG